MSDTAHPLDRFRKTHGAFVGVDSDGCAFDTMELKHKECFIPNIIKHFGLQAVSRYAREAAEFVNLYSRGRGTNRFPALLEALSLLDDRDEVTERGVTIPRLRELEIFVASGVPLGNPSLEEACRRTGSAELEAVLAWSTAVNESVAAMGTSVPPFPHVRQALEAMEGSADVMVVSATPVEALEREWRAQGLDGFVQLIAGQEMGPKRAHLAAAHARGYPSEAMLMIGDAPGDLRAAKAVHAHFFPIVPGAEAESWARLVDEGLERFFDGTYAGAYEDRLVAGFLEGLPETPPWVAS